MLEWINRLMSRVESWFQRPLVAEMASEEPQSMPARDLAGAASKEAIAIAQLPNVEGRKLKLYDVRFRAGVTGTGPGLACDGIVTVVSEVASDQTRLKAAALTWLKSRGFDSPVVAGIKELRKVDFVHFHSLPIEQDANDGHGNSQCG